MKLQRLLSLGGALIGGMLLTQVARAELAVVINSVNGVDNISVEEVAQIFLGKTRKLPDGTKVVPLDQLELGGRKEEFYAKVTNKSLPQLNSYWSRLIFTGRGQPPYAVSGDAEVLELVSANPNMIGYVDVISLAAETRPLQIKVLLKIQ